MSGNIILLINHYNYFGVEQLCFCIIFAVNIINNITYYLVFINITYYVCILGLEIISCIHVELLKVHLVLLCVNIHNEFEVL